MCSVRGAYVPDCRNLTLLFARLTAALRGHGWPARLLVGLVVPAIVAGCSDTRSSAAAIEAPAATQQVKAITVTQQPLTRVITVTGTLAAEEQVALSFKVAGRVDQVLVDLGSVV